MTSLCNATEEKFLPIDSTKKVFILSLQIKHNLSWKMKLLKQADNIGYVIPELLKYIKINMQTSSGSSLQSI